MPDFSRSDVDPSSRIAHREHDAGSLWGVVLAENRGPQPPGVTPSCNGVDLFKQYRTETGHRYMVQRTLDRVSTLIAPDKRLVVTCRGRLEKGLEEIRESDGFVVQPRNRDTAPGVLLTLLRIQDQDPEATVAIVPAEHCAFIPDEHIFMAHVFHGIKFLATYPDLLILFGTGPDRPEIADIWIEPGQVIARQSEYQLLQVRSARDIDTQDRPMGTHLNAEGGLWNSRIVLGRLSTLLQSFEKTLPELWERFQRIEAALHNADILEDVYRGMPVANFSRHILQRIPQGLGVVPVTEEPHTMMFKTSGAAKAGVAEEALSRPQRRYRRWEGVA